MKLENVSKKYNDHTVLDSLNLTLNYGEIYGLFGPNGAGKSTLMKCILNMIKPDSGIISINGITIESDRNSYLSNIGYVPDTPFIYNYLTAREYLDFIADLQDIDKDKKERKIDYLLDKFSLMNHQNKMISTFSFGMKHKLSLAGAIIHNPNILLLDEPLSSFDPPTMKSIKKFLRDYAKEGNLILMSTHLVYIAKELCDKVGILNNGKIIAEYEQLKELRNLEELIIADMEENL